MRSSKGWRGILNSRMLSASAASSGSSKGRAPLGVTGVQRLPVTGHLAGRFIRREPAVHDVIASAGESVNRLDGAPLLARKKHK